jgi:hypothetical protein
MSLNYAWDFDDLEPLERGQPSGRFVFWRYRSSPPASGRLIQDAVAAANILAAPLREGRLTDGDLRRGQKRRALPTRLTQSFNSPSKIA